MTRRSLWPCVTFFPQPTTLIGTRDGEGRYDLMTASWAGIVSKTPATLGVSLNRGRQTYENLVATGEFSVCVVPETLLAAADFCGLASGRTVDKFARTGLTPEAGAHIRAPLVAESPLCVECRVSGEVDLGEYRLVLGEILDIRVSEAALDEAGKLTGDGVAPLVYLGGVREYWRLGGKVGTAYRDGKTFFADGD